MAKRKDKQKRYLESLNKNPKLIKTWRDLHNCKSPTHYIEPSSFFSDRHRYIGGHVYAKDKTLREKEKYPYYLSTHTFYGSEHEKSTKELQKRGFNVIIDNWDKGKEIDG